MRKLAYLSFWLIFFSPALVFAQWEGAQVSRLTNDVYTNRLYNVMEIDKNDKIYLIYLQDPKPYTSNVTDFLITKEKGSAWSAPLEIGNPAFKSTTYGHHRFGIDLRNGVIHCLYAYGDTLFYTNSALNWQVTKIDSNAHYGAGDNLYCDSLGNVHFSWSYAYIDSGYDYYHVIYMTNATGQWVKQQVSPEIFIGYGGSPECPMAVEKNGRAHIFYYTYDFLYHMVNDTLGGTNWSKDSLAYPFCCANWVGGFKIGKDNSLHMLFIGSNILYPQQDEDYSTWYYYRDSGSTHWTAPEVVVDSSRGDWLFVDNQGDPHVGWGVYYYANKKKGYWESTKIVDQTSNKPEILHFVLDSQGKGYAAFIGYPDRLLTDSAEVYYFGPSPGIVSQDNPERPLSFQLKQNYPNPFNPNTTIPVTVYRSQFIVHRPIHTTLKIYNILGQLVRVLVDEEKRAGDYQVIWDGKDQDGKEVKSGIYFYVLKCEKYRESKKMLLIR